MTPSTVFQAIGADLGSCLAFVLCACFAWGSVKLSCAKSKARRESEEAYRLNSALRKARNEGYERGWLACYKVYFPVHPLGHPVSRATIESLIGSRVVEAES